MRGFETLTPADGELYWFCRKKRPALPETRAALLEILRDFRNRIDEYVHPDDTPLTPEERWQAHKMTHEIRRRARSHWVEGEAKIEAEFWQLMKDIGCIPKGGLQ